MQNLPQMKMPCAYPFDLSVHAYVGADSEMDGTVGRARATDAGADGGERRTEVLRGVVPAQRLVCPRVCLSDVPSTVYERPGRSPDT